MVLAQGRPFFLKSDKDLDREPNRRQVELVASATTHAISAEGPSSCTLAMRKIQLSLPGIFSFLISSSTVVHTYGQKFQVQMPQVTNLSSRKRVPKHATTIYASQDASNPPERSIQLRSLRQRLAWSNKPSIYTSALQEAARIATQAKLQLR